MGYLSKLPGRDLLSSSISSMQAIGASLTLSPTSHSDFIIGEGIVAESQLAQRPLTLQVRSRMG